MNIICNPNQELNVIYAICFRKTNTQFNFARFVKTWS